MKKTGQKKVSAKSLKVYKFAAAAADKKLAAAELAVASTPSVENQQVLAQAQAAASAAHRKLEGAAAPVGGNTSEKGRRGREVQINGTAAPTLPRFDDLEACAEAVCDREAWENALALMRGGGGAWCCCGWRWQRPAGQQGCGAGSGTVG